MMSKYVEVAETIIGTIVLSLTYAGVTAMICYLGWSISHSVLGHITAQFMHDVAAGITKGLAAKIGLSVGLGSALAIGVPSALFAYHLIYAIANNQLGVSLKNAKSWLMVSTSYALPYASFVLSMAIGAPVAPALWVTFGLATVGGLVMSELGQAILQPIISNSNNNVGEPLQNAASQEPIPSLTDNHALKPAENIKALTPGFDTRKIMPQIENKPVVYPIDTSEPRAKVIF